MQSKHRSGKAVYPKSKIDVKNNAGCCGSVIFAGERWERWERLKRLERLERGIVILTKQSEWKEGKMGQFLELGIE